MDTQPVAATKTGIARSPSRLPTTSRLPAARPRPTSLAASSALVPPSQKTIPQASPVKPAAAAATPTSKLQRKTPTPGLARPTAVSSLKPPSTGLPKPGTVRTNNFTRPTPAKASATPGIVPPRPRSGLQKRSLSTFRPAAHPEDEENHDKLSSLDSFRSASRQGFSDEAESLENVEPADATLERRSSRPSLSERTIESLQSVPSTPNDRRRSSFFNPPDSPMGPPARPASAMSRTGGTSSRPGTSDGTFTSRPLSRAGSSKIAPASARPSTRTSTVTTSRISSLPSTNATKLSTSGGLTSKLQQARAESQRAVSPAKKPSALPHGSSIGLPASNIGAGNKTVATSRPAKSRPPLGSIFTPPVKRVPTKPSVASADDAQTPGDTKRLVSNSSAALREQIAAAKAAARKQRESAAKRVSSPSHATSINGDTAAFEVENHADPFGQAPKDERHVLKYRVHNARMTGKLNVAAMGLKEMPEEILKMYDATAMAESKVNWAEVVDLTKFIAADNEFEHIADSVFPDRSNEELAADEEAEGNQFGGLELLDLHGNSLHALPIGLRQLERLTHLNVAHNKLENSALDVITQIPTLKELRLGNNNLTGNLPSSICGLTKLEVLDVQTNRLLSLPEALADLVGLRVLNVSGNQLTALPMDALAQISLIELDASSNALIASLFPLGGPSGHPTLQSLNVANNSLAALTFSEALEMPKLKTLHLTNNQMTALPSVTSWTELITLHVGDNKIVDFPEGFTSLPKLRNANFTSNELRMLDPEICRMNSLDSFVLAANPLREKKFLTMNAADIKHDLRARLAPRSEAGTDDGEPTSPVTVDYAENSGSHWAVKGNGLLSLSGKDLAEDLDDDLSTFLHNNSVRQLQLQESGITVIPPVLSLVQDLRTLDLSGNPFSAEYLTDEISLPTLQELNISRCRLTSLDLLMTFVQAPNLKILNISANRLSGDLPTFRTVYPQLTTLFATDNKIRTITADALRGLTTVNLASNDIEALPAEVGLLWDEGLRSFEVGSNAFRVPNYRLLDKGTEATLRWLRDRLPAGEGGRVDEVD